MYLKQSKRNGRTYLSIVRSYRDGGRVRTKTVESLGYADELARTHGDPVAFGRKRAEQLNAQEKSGKAPVTIELARDEQIELSGSDGIQLGSAITLAYLDALGIDAYFDHHAARAPQNLAATLKFLASARMQHAAPIHETWRNRSRYPGTCPERFTEVCQALEALAGEQDDLVAHLNRRYEALRGPRRLEVVSLVMSDYVFRSPLGPTEGGIDEVRSPQWSRLCLAIDGAGIPLGYRIVPRDLRTDDVLSLVEDVHRRTGAHHVALVAAQLPNTIEVMGALASRGDYFTVLFPTESYDDELASWIEASEGYAKTRNGFYRVKSRLTQHDSPAGILSLREIAFRSTARGTVSGYCLVSNQSNLSDRAVFNIYRELWRVHEPFQIVSADFVAVPYPLSVRDHLVAHFLVCYVAFFALRVLRQDMDWRYDAAQVADALTRLEGTQLSENWYLFSYRTAVTDTIEKAAGCPVGLRIMSRGDVRHAIVTMRRTIEKWKKVTR